MQAKAHIGIDIMGGESSPQAIFEAVLEMARSYDGQARFLVITDESVHDELMKFYSQFPSRERLNLDLVTTKNYVTMEDPPLFAVRKKKNSSMAVGINLLAEKKIDAFLSLGNTGALVLFATHLLKRLMGIKRPALLVLLPTLNGKVAVLDVGANISFKSEDLIDFAKLGLAYQAAVGHAHPLKLGLLNIGAEEKKGTKEVKQAFQLLSEKFGDQFVGNVEGCEVFQGRVDVLVTDGFTGNVFLKTCEGASSFFMDYLKSVLKNAQAGDSILSEICRRFNYSEHPGAVMVGLDGLVIKCHGYSNKAALLSGLKGALQLAENNFTLRMKKFLEET